MRDDTLQVGSKERPVLFSGPMVRAILDGRKSQTRRIVSPSTSYFGSAGPEYWDHADFDAPHPAVLVDGSFGRGQYLHVPCHCQTGEYYKLSRNVDCETCKENGWEDTRHRLYCRWEIGDRLWVREAWALPPSYDPKRHGDLKSKPSIGPVCYREGYPSWSPWPGTKWRPSIHMPRWASRITLEITDIRVERLQDISEEDAEAEGVPGNLMGRTHRIGFENLWNSIHGCNAFQNSNPWVWVVAFKRLETELG